MSLTIKTNLSSLIAQNSLKTSTNKLNQAIERMSSGAKINHAKDNAANYSIATNMTTKINALQVAEDNCAMGLDLISTASSSLEQMSDLTSRLRSLATQAQNGTYGDKSIEAINTEAQALVDEMLRIKNTTQYNGIYLLGKSKNGEFVEEVIKRNTSAMTTLASVDESTSLTSGTFSISSAEELVKLATMTNAGLIGADTEFVLANDIDLSAYSTGEGWTPIGATYKKFSATFDGNGYVVSNLYINRPDEDAQGLFGKTSATAIIKNIGVIDVDVTANNYVGGLVGNGYEITISNCYATGNVTGNTYVGGLVGSGYEATISNCYATGNITGNSYAGGLVGQGDSATITNCHATSNVLGDTTIGGLVGGAYKAITISNSYATGSVTGTSSVGGVIGSCALGVIISDSYATSNVVGGSVVGGLVGTGNNAIISNCYATGMVIGSYCVGGLVGHGISATIRKCYATGSVSYTNGGSGGTYLGGVIGYGKDATLENAYYSETTGRTMGIFGTPTSGTATLVIKSELEELIEQGVLLDYKDTSNEQSFSLQVGINSFESSQIGISITPLDISALDGLDLSGTNAIETFDEILNTINDQQITFGAAQNRLESVLDEISTQYENLVSSRSTIMDADMAEVSSEYIRQQILQQASATLMATANQSPSIALQLI